MAAQSGDCGVSSVKRKQLSAFLLLWEGLPEAAVPRSNLPGICGEKKDTFKIRWQVFFSEGQGLMRAGTGSSLLIAVYRLVSSVANYFCILAMQRKGTLKFPSGNLIKCFGINSVAA